LKTILKAAILFPLLLSCDILRSSPFEVSSWSPGGGYHQEPAAISVALEFSHEPDRVSVERYFSITEDGSRLKGSFRWEGKRVIFLPAAPLEPDRDYEISLAADASDDSGLSLDESFEGNFTTRPENSRPALISVSPPMNAVVGDSRAAVSLVFSRPVALVSLREQVSFDPSMSGSWQLEGDGSAAVFTPAEPWTYGRRCEIRVSASLAGINGMDMGRDYISVFTLGTDREKPVLTGAWRLSHDGGKNLLAGEVSAGDSLAAEPFAGQEPAGTFFENSGWEKGDRLVLEFSEPVDSLSVKNCLSADGAPGIVMESPPGFSAAPVFRFESRPAFESRFFFNLNSGVKDAAGNESAEKYSFRIFADGIYSRPPSLAGVRIPMAPASADPELISYATGDLFADLPLTNGDNRYPYSTAKAAWIELYFDTAPGAEMDALSVMECFRIDTSNNVLVFSPQSVRDKDFTTAEPEQRWKNSRRLEIGGFLTNTINSGVVNIEIAPGLRDSLGNRSEEKFIISLLK
jgi:hypothetical protein